MRKHVERIKRDWQTFRDSIEPQLAVKRASLPEWDDDTISARARRRRFEKARNYEHQHQDGPERGD